MAYLLLTEHFQTIQNQARLEAIAEKGENPLQTVTLPEITLKGLFLKYIPYYRTLQTKSLKIDSTR